MCASSREALLAAGPVVGEYGLETRRVVFDDHFDERGGRQVVLAQLVEQQHIGPQIRVLGAALQQRVEIALRGDVIDFFGGFGPHAFGQPRHTLEEGGSSGLIASRTNATTSLTCTASA